ncbi:RidA family protein [Patescibacteria group bacterium]
METIKTDSAPQAIGPYSQAVKNCKLVFCSGQIPLTSNGNLIDGDVAEQTHQVMKNLKAVLEAAESSLDKVVKTTIFLTDMNDFTAVNDVYATYFPSHKPARATVEVSRLPKDVKVEIDCIASI